METINVTFFRLSEVGELFQVREVEGRERWPDLVQTSGDNREKVDEP